MPAPKKTKASRKKRAAPPKRSAARKRARATGPLVDALGEAGWRDADVALAEALADLDELEAADASHRDGALAVLAQSLARAARRRGLTRIGALTAQQPYDPAAHDLRSAVAKMPKTVRIQARGVARGGQVLVKPRVAVVKAKARRKRA
jgi:hypothetical protein